MIVKPASAPATQPVAPPAEPAGSNRRLRWGLTIGLAGLAVAAIFYDTVVSGAGLPYLYQRFQTFVTIFLGIFIEAVPFLLAGSVVSGLIAVFVDNAMLDRFLPQRPFLGAMAGGMLGFLFPVCECGVVPVVRRLYEKGLPVSIGVSFLLAAPVVNPIVILSTYSAFGWGPVLWGRLLFSFLIAVTVGYLFSRAQPDEVLTPTVNAHHHDACCTVHTPQTTTVKPPLGDRFSRAFNLAGDDFLDMVRYLIVGSLIAASMQTLIPQSALIAVGQGPIISVIVMLALAFVLSICSTVDAFLALAFSTTFTTGSVVSFLVFGPMVDIKSTIMFLGVFRRKAVVYLIILPLVLSALVGIWWNLNIGL